MSVSLYELADKVEGRLDDFAFAERTAKVEQALTATQVLPIKRAVQHETQHKKLAAIFVQAFDSDTEFDLDYVSKSYNRRLGLPSNIYTSLRFMELLGLIKSTGAKSWKLDKLAPVAAPLTAFECINA